MKFRIIFVATACFLLHSGCRIFIDCDPDEFGVEDGGVIEGGSKIDNSNGDAEANFKCD